MYLNTGRDSNEMLMRTFRNHALKRYLGIERRYVAALFLKYKKEIMLDCLFKKTLGITKHL